MRRVVILAAVIFVSLVYMTPLVATAPAFTQASHIEIQEHSQLAQESQVVLTEHGSKTYLGGNQWRYRSSIGQRNTWNGEEYVPYIWDHDLRSVEYAGLTMEFYDWYIVLMNSTHTLIDDARWQLYYQNKQGEWRMLDLYSHSWLPASINEENMTFGQSYTDGSNTMNITYLFRNCDEVKISAEILLAEDMTIQLRWQTTGILEAPEYVKDIDTNFTGGVCFQDLNIIWSDVIEFNGINATFDYQAMDHKIEVLFSDISIAANELYLLDPTYTVSADEDDDCWQEPYGSPIHCYSYDIIDYSNKSVGPSFRGQLRLALSIPKDATITTASLFGYEIKDDATKDHTIWRIDETNVGSLESDSSMPSRDTSIESGWSSNDVGGEWVEIDVANLVQAQVNLAGWSSGYYMGFAFETDSETMLDSHTFEDYQKASPKEAYLEVEYSEGGPEQKTVLDTLNISSATIKGVYVVVLDTLGILSVSVFVFLKALTDILSLASTSLVIVEKLITDTLSLSSVHSMVNVFLRTMTDTLNISSTSIVMIQKVLTDTLNLSSIESHLIIFQKLIEDTLQLGSSVSMSVFKSMSDTLNISSAHSMVNVFLRTMTDTLNISSTSIVMIQKVLTDTLNLSSIETHLIVFQKAVTDTLIISSVISKEIGKTITDTLNISSAHSVVVAFARTMTDTLNISSVHSTVVAFARTMTDTLNISSAKSFLFKMVQVDTLIIASVTTKEVQKSVSDILQIASTVDPVPTYGEGPKYKTVEDTLIFESSVSRPPNIFYELFLSSRMWGYIGPMALVIIGYIISKKEVILGILWFIVECLFIAHYLELVEAAPNYWWHIIILLLGGLFTCIYPLWDRRV